MTPYGRSVHQEVQAEASECRLCYGSGWIADQTETSFGEFEDVFYLCSACSDAEKTESKKERMAD